MQTSPQSRMWPFHAVAARPQESGEALLDRIRAGKAAGGAPPAAAAPAVRELCPAEAAKDEGNKAFKRGDWQEAAAHYSR